MKASPIATTATLLLNSLHRSSQSSVRHHLLRNRYSFQRSNSIPCAFHSLSGSNSIDNSDCSSSGDNISGSASNSISNNSISSSNNNNHHTSNIKMTDAVANMQRGHNGRIEEAFAAAKNRGEAAFVTFVTAGFPVKEGETIFY